MVAELRKYLKDIKATVEQFNNTEDFSHIVQNDNLISLDYINDLLEPIGDVLNCALNRAVFQKTITRTIPDIKYILRSFKPFSIKMDFAEVEPKSMEFIYLNKVYTLFIYLLSELVDYCRISKCDIGIVGIDNIDPMSRYSIPTQGDFKKETIPSNSSDQETKESKNTYRKNNHFDKSTETSLLEDSFNKLLTGEYIHPNSTLQQWTYICTGQGDGNIEPLKWISTNRELAFLIDSLFGKSNSGNLWEVTFNCFEKDGKKPNKGTLKNYISKINKSYLDTPDKMKGLQEIKL